MAFTQARAIALINTSISLRNALTAIRDQAASLQYELNAGRITPDQAFKALSFCVSDANLELFQDFPTLISIINTEHAHFSRNVKRNDYEAKRARERRDAANPDRRPYSHYTKPYETNCITPISYKPPGMNARGDLPPDHASKLASTSTPKYQAPTQEEFDAAVAAAGGIYTPSTIEEEEAKTMKREEELSKQSWNIASSPTESGSGTQKK